MTHVTCRLTAKNRDQLRIPLGNRVWATFTFFLLSDNLNDDDDVYRELKCLLVRTNMLLSRFRHCSKNVKLVSFRSFCLCMYDVALWKYYLITAFSK